VSFAPFAVKAENSKLKTERSIMSKLNILYIHGHDTGRSVGPYGFPSDTPRIQALAEQGVLFRQAYCAAPTCSPSRASLLTGQYAHNAGMLGLAHRGFSLYDTRQHLAHTLRAAGYRTALFGVQHLTRNAQAGELGYDAVWTERTDVAGVAPQAAAWLAATPPEPFFLDVGFSEVHRPFPAPGPRDDARYTAPMRPLPDTPETRADAAGFHAGARALDSGVGAVLDALDAAGLAERTLVICTTDHGPAFPGMKSNLTDGGTGVMLIARGPGEWRGGKVVDALVSHIDLFPTLCELAGIAQPSWLQGQSLAPLLGGQAEEVRDAVFSEVTFHAAYEPQRAVRTRRWKYIRRFDGRERPVLPNVDDSPSKDVWLRAGWQERPVPAESLFDLVFDPGESYNLATSAAHADVLADMRVRLDSWMRDTADPLLSARLALPPGLVVNDPDGLSPSEPTRPA
jgi:arylsulfatase A-like enzyme